MALDTYTRAELREQVLDYLRTHLAGVNAATYSYHWFLAQALGSVLRNAQAPAVYLGRQIFPTTADEEYLVEHADARVGDRLAATAATGKLLYTVTGAGPHAIPIGQSASHASGGSYTADSAGATALPAWSGKTCAPGSSAVRVVVAPDASGMAVGDVLTIGGEVRAIKDILPNTGSPIAIEFYRALSAAPAPTTVITATEGAVLTHTATTTGLSTNLDAGESVALDSPPAGVAATATILEMGGGADLETVEELRARVTAFDRERPGAGNRNDWRMWARDSNATGVRIEDAFVYMGARGLGTVDVVPFGPSGRRQTGTAVNDAIEAHLATVAGAWDDWDVVQLQDASPDTVTISLSGIDGNYAPDWSGSVTTTGTPGTSSVINVAADPRLAMEVGDRILVPVDTTVDGRLEQHVVASLTVSTITVVGTMSAAAQASAVIYPGGPLAQPTIDAVLALYDAVGPGESATVGGQRWPEASEIPTHVSTINLACAADNVPGSYVAGISTVPSVLLPTGVYERATLGQLTLVYT